MARLKPIKQEDMTPAQANAYRKIEAQGGRLGGPYTALIRLPEFMLLHQDMGDWVRKTSLSERLRKLIVLTTVKHWGAKYAWQTNIRAAAREGIDRSIVDAIGEGRQPALSDAKERSVVKVAHELLEARQLSDATYQEALASLGETALAETVATTGFYSMVSITLNAFDVDPPPAK